MMEVKISRCFRYQNLYEAVWFKLLQKESLLYGNKLLAQVLLSLYQMHVNTTVMFWQENISNEDWLLFLPYPSTITNN